MINLITQEIYCLIITNNNTNYSHVMLVVLVDLYQVLILVKIRGYADGQTAFFYEAAVSKY